MADRLPPLTALRAFEAAARHLSFAKAAEELHVTPAALSFQIKSLETHLGRPLFRRLNRAVELTEAGRALMPGAAEGFAALSRGWRAARRLANTSTLTVTAGPAFLAKWLAPRLFDFAHAHPEIELRFSASLRVMDFERDEIDVAIRFGVGPDPGLYSIPLIREWSSPMMTPALAEVYRAPEDLRQAPLLHQDPNAFQVPLPGWTEWFRAADLGEVPKGGPIFSQPDHSVDAALAGAGVVLGRLSLTYGALRDGALVAPFPLALTTASQYRFVCPEGMESRPQVAVFREWILNQMAELKTFAPHMRLLDPE